MTTKLNQFAIILILLRASCFALAAGSIPFYGGSTETQKQKPRKETEGED